MEESRDSIYYLLVSFHWELILVCKSSLALQFLRYQFLSLILMLQYVQFLSVYFFPLSSHILKTCQWVDRLCKVAPWR